MRIAFLLLAFFLSNGTTAQEKKIYSKLPCAAEVWQAQGENWEEIILCDLNPKDPTTWTWYYNYKTNKKGLLKLKIISQWQDDTGSNFLIKIPNNPNKYKLSQMPGSKDIKMEKVEGNMSIEYMKVFIKKN